ncbi:ribosomal protein L17 [Fragilariopsis cylindrus CCMP1102]|uniref:Ribosomal protein L17 n=1 Tax=Fragilariopsis cylindrus CCMP1102 TaxID=635003 RepID=A0A1E7FQ30_9STRA|nr:ribosomal protein L17 [Fragilariopsis cylindrus CCMP1102]|eukprot:OEU20258.1 ribosomal protein L17 [Fragilariopsis cylindrus CCMP1102]
MKKRLAQFRKLNRTPSHKWSMLRNMMSSLIEHERIVTTEAKAKELRHLADQMITLAKKGNTNYNAIIMNTNNNTDSKTKRQKTAGELLHYRRMASKVIRGDWNITKLFEVLGPRYILRQGGYTRVLKLSKPRAGDNAPMAVIEYVDRPGEIRPARPPTILSSDASDGNNVNAKNANLQGGGGVEDALRKMGIRSVDELVSEEEKKQIESELALAAQEKTEEKK